MCVCVSVSSIHVFYVIAKIPPTSAAPSDSPKRADRRVVSAAGSGC